MGIESILAKALGSRANGLNVMAGLLKSSLKTQTQNILLSQQLREQERFIAKEKDNDEYGKKQDAKKAALSQNVNPKAFWG